MTDNDKGPTEGEPPLAVKKKASERGFSPIWIIPLVALAIGLFLVYRVISETGPTITISFEEASGLEAGKTKIKFKDVPVGEVASINLKDDLSGVTLTADMSRGAAKYMTDKTRFWIVRPQISAESITGLGTLLSGNYISMEPSKEGNKTHSFIGLERPPVIRSDEAGSYFNILAKELGGLDFGSPVYFRQIEVGSVVRYAPREDGDIELEIFVKEPFDKQVNEASRFWNAGGFDVSLGADGLEIKTQSLATIISGGIAFDTVQGIGQDASKHVSEDHVFHLYGSRTASRKRIYVEKRRVLFYFDDPVRGLEPGAPVELRGYKVGKVLDVRLEFDRENSSFKIPVMAEIEPRRLIIHGESDFETTLTHLVERGFRASLKSGNILFGKLLISLDMHPDEPGAQADFSGPLPIIPTVRGSIGQILNDARALISELRQTGATINAVLESKSFESGVDDLAASLGSIRNIAAKIDTKTAPRLNAVLVETESTLQEAQAMLATNSTTRTEINRLLVELAEAARSIRLLADYLEQHPESLLKGKD